MPISECEYCGGACEWHWEEAFDKFGFGDGDLRVYTSEVEDVLAEAGYDVTAQEWGMHNVVITSIKRDGKELISMDDPDVSFGYDNPRSYLPEEIVRLLDEKLPSDRPYEM